MKEMKGINMNNIENALCGLPTKNVSYCLTKTTYGLPSMVRGGSSVKGRLEILEWEGQFMVRVWSDDPNCIDTYIRTSAVRDILRVTKNTVVFETANSVYTLEKT